MQDFVTGSMIALLIVTYLIWRKYAALKAREELAGHLENVLTDNSLNLKEKEKLALTYFWQHSASPLFILRVLYPVVVGPKHGKNKKQKLDEKKRDVVVLLFLKSVLVNAKLMPLTYLIFLCVIFVVVVVFSNLTKITSKTKQGVSQFLKEPHYN